ncbi:nitroreductase family deazaflavin-dependent oxidoreductase [[Mycobacterium] holstebronense]|uniref:Nitroreductase family deazaflavin-dependent oxidoreductase n=1 Tax=[Mycobacterium] holstebronense TaxID=3064288 RepID=A0ABM9LEP5_9MYCO|nr:nitroreductase family deazaflavin-dependent oxidoreductase [Mycolicibacter sp. MU0102]CAJ1497794.1 nitroreductase family deazaflavin-dependent oxidoreductase [Mycolicibacter sp. MU0102]
MQFSDRRARFNRVVTNPLFRPICGWVPMWSIVEHTGRRSGATYRTPVSMFHTADGVAVLLPYGTGRDWVKNLQAADGGRVKVGGKTFAVKNPHVVPTEEAIELLKAPWRQLLGRAGVPHTLLLTRA